MPFLQPTFSRNKGFTLTELLIAIAIISIFITSGLNYYHHYIKETHLNVAKMNMQSLRVFLEDYYLRYGTYLTAKEQNIYNKAELYTHFGWQPEGDNNQYTYTVITTNQSWDIVVTRISRGYWLRCEQRMKNCCDSGTPDATPSACP